MTSGPRNGTDPSMLAFCSPLYEDAALNELATLLSARPRPRLAPGLFALDTALSGEEIQTRLAYDPPIFTRQIMADVTAAAREGDPLLDAERLLASPALTGGGMLVVSDAAGRCQADLVLLCQHLTTSRASTSTTTHATGVIALPGRLWAGRILAGAGLVNAPAWAGGRPAYAYDSTLVSRSALKLIEAIDVFGVPIGEHGQALDLGAAPGGWSQVLAARGMTVTAVDPGALDPRVLELPSVFAHRLTARQFLATAMERYGLIVDDMRLDARESARILAHAADLLHAGGSAIITLKLPERRPSAALRHALDLLRQRFFSVRARCLYYNRHEVTCHARVS